MRHTSLALGTVIVGLTLLALPASAAQDGGDDNWPTWRGADSTGVALSTGAPTTWDEESNIRWKLDLPGKGSSTPIVWGDHLFVTTAIETDRKPEGAPEAAPEPETEPEGGRGRGRGGRGRRGSPAPTQIHEFWVMAVSRASGEIAWKTKATETVPHEAGHNTNTQASASPITDGEHIFAFFGSRGVFCLDMQGEVVWSKEFGKMQTRNQFGEGASPALHGDTLVVLWDHEGDDFIAAFDKNTGEEKWRTERDEATTWVTPLIAPVGDGHQVIVTATSASRGYDLETGNVVWSLGGMTSNCIPTPIYRDGHVWLMSGYRGASLQRIKLEGAKGDLADSENVLWQYGQGTSYVPSGLLKDDHIYFLRGNTGVLNCLNAMTGEPVYTGQRLGDIKSVYASLTASGDNVYVPSRAGLTMVFQAGAEYKEVAANLLDDTFDASPTIVDDELFLRGWNSLYCIANAK